MEGSVTTSTQQQSITVLLDFVDILFLFQLLFESDMLNEVIQ